MVYSFNTALSVIQLQTYRLLEQISLHVDVLYVCIDLLNPLVILLQHAAVEPSYKSAILTRSEDFHFFLAV